MKKCRDKLIIVVDLIALAECIILTHFSPTLRSNFCKFVTLAAAIIFFLIFILVLPSAIKKINIGKKKASGLSFIGSFLFIIVFFPIISYYSRSSEVLLFLPLIALLLYWIYIKSNFIGLRKSDEMEVKLYLKSLKEYIRKQTNFMNILIVVLFFIFLVFITGIVNIPVTFGRLYDVSLTVYAVIFSVVTAFGVLGLVRDEAKPRNSALKRPLLGLAHMCIVFFLISLVGTILGADVDTSLFASGTTLGKAFSEGFGVGVIRILLIETIIISFPFTLIYLYTILRAFLLEEKKP